MRINSIQKTILEEETNTIKEKNKKKKITEIIARIKIRSKKHHEEARKLLFGLANQVSLCERVITDNLEKKSGLLYRMKRNIRLCLKKSNARG